MKQVIHHITYKVTNTHDKNDNQNMTIDVSKWAHDNPGFHFTNMQTTWDTISSR